MMFARPNNLTEALALLGNDDWSILSGGTDFYPSLRDQPVRGKVIDLWALDELRQVQHGSDYLRLGALTTWSDIIGMRLPAAFDGLKLAAREVGSIQIQNRGTIAGNICNASPAADGIPPLLTLDAIVELQSSKGVRTLPLAEFIVGNRVTSMHSNELVTAVLIPSAAMLGQSSFLKLGSRHSLVISISMVAVRLVCADNGYISGAAISVGSCSLVAQRLHALESTLVGQSATSDLSQLVTREHLHCLAPIDDIRATAHYRLDATQELIKRALTEVGSKFV